MNRQTFLAYLEEPSKLYQLPLIELQGLVLEYPYSPNLRLLLLLKARMENHPRQAEMLQQLSARTFDREYLYDQLREMDRQEAREAVVKEEKLELQDLNKLDFSFVTNNESDPAEMQATSMKMPVPAYDSTEDDSLAEEEMEVPQNDLLASISNELPFEEDSLEDSGADEVVIQEGLESTRHFESDTEALFGALKLEDVPEAPELIAPAVRSSDLSYLDNVIAVATSLSEVTRDYHTNYQPPRPVPTEQLVQIQEDAHAKPARVKARLRRHRVKQLDKMKHRERDQLKEIARHSVSAHEEVASETLAKLLTRQGEFAKAIKMYHRLSLLNPEKKANFAGLIQELKEKL